MTAWRKGKKFASILERKQQILQGDRIKVENRLAKIRLTIAEYQQECANINQQIKLLTPSGLHSRADIYKGIRQQGALLTYQQLVLHKIDELEYEKSNLEDTLEQYRAAKSLLDKKQYKFSYYLQLLRRAYIQRCDNDAENETQEITGYGGKNF